MNHHFSWIDWFQARVPAGLRAKLKRAAHHLRFRFASRIILGAGPTHEPGWLATDQPQLDLTNRADFARHWKPDSRRAFLAEHVLEHLNPAQTRAALANCFTFLQPGGRFRIAVPDGLHTNAAYLDHVRPHGPMHHEHQHQVLYTYRTLPAVLEAAGFEVHLLEYWDESGTFHHHPWSAADGRIHRCAALDQRNEPGRLAYTSLIVDAIKPLKQAPKSTLALPAKYRQAA